MPKNQLILSILVILIIVGAGWHLIANHKQSGQETIRIGFLAPLTGEEAIFGENEQKGINLAVEQINAAGGVNGKKIEIVVEDSKCDPKLATNAAQKLITVDKVVAVVGDTCSAGVLAIAPIATEAQVPFITPVAGSDAISGISPYIFRNFIPNREYASFAATYIRDVLKKDKVAVLYSNSAYGENMADDFLRLWKGTVVSRHGYASETKDFRSILAEIKATDPELIYLTSYYNDGALILKQARELGIQTPFFGSGDAYDDPAFISLAGEGTTDGFVYLTAPTATGPIGGKFLDAFRSTYGQEPPAYADYAYDALSVLVEAMKIVEQKQQTLSGNTIIAALHEVEFASASGVIKFDDKNDVINPRIIVKRIQDGKALQVSD